MKTQWNIKSLFVLTLLTLGILSPVESFAGSHGNRQGSISGGCQSRSRCAKPMRKKCSRRFTMTRCGRGGGGCRKRMC